MEQHPNAMGDLRPAEFRDKAYGRPMTYDEAMNRPILPQQPAQPQAQPQPQPQLNADTKVLDFVKYILKEALASHEHSNANALASNVEITKTTIHSHREIQQQPARETPWREIAYSETAASYSFLRRLLLLPRANLSHMMATGFRCHHHHNICLGGLLHWYDLVSTFHQHQDYLSSPSPSREHPGEPVLNMMILNPAPMRP